MNINDTTNRLRDMFPVAQVTSYGILENKH